jgi:hypothetical protein
VRNQRVFFVFSVWFIFLIQGVFIMAKVAVVFHSGYGHTLRMAQSVADGRRLPSWLPSTPKACV